MLKKLKNTLDNLSRLRYTIIVNNCCLQNTRIIYKGGKIQ